MKRKLDETTAAGGIAVGAAASPKPKIDASIYTGVKQKSKAKDKSAERNESVNEDELSKLNDLQRMSDTEFMKKYGMTKKQFMHAKLSKSDPAFRMATRQTQPVTEEEIAEDEVLIIPGRMPKRKTGLVPRGQDRTDHEVAMARSDLLAAFKNAKTIYGLLKDRSEEVGIEGWVQEKLIKANDYLNAVREYYEEQATQNDLDGKYGMQSTCDCGPQCSCGPDFGSMFESAMREGANKRIKDGDPCWDSHKMVGMKKGKGGKPVPNCVPKESVEIQEKAKSRQQQKFFGMVHALQKGEEIPGASAKLKKTAASMSKGDVADFAKTKHSGLPTKVKKKS